MFLIHAEQRLQYGTSHSKRLRKLNNRIPSIIYGLNKPSMYISLDHDNILNIQKKPEFYYCEITLIISDKKYIVCLQSIQRHAFKMKLLHIDFLYKI